jgi:hypothetical protein
VKLDRRFPLHVAVTFVGGLSLAVIPLAITASREVILAVVAGATLSTLNVLAGFLAIEYSLEKSYTTFLKVVLGGMGIRMALMLGILFLLIKFAGLHTIALVVSVLGFYIIYLVLELLYVQNKVSQKNQSNP